MRNKHLTKSLMAGVVASALILSPMATQAGNWAGVVIPIGGLALTLATAGTVAVMTAINTDAAQIAAEALVYAAMLSVTDEWSPEPEKSYEKAAESNDDGSTCSTTTVTEEGSMPFAVQSLTATGIEVVPLDPNPSIFVNSSARQSVMQALTRLGGQDPNLTFREMSASQESAIVSDRGGSQQRNEQWISTEGIARAELALMTVQQGAVDDGASLTDTASSLETADKSDIQMASAVSGTRQQTLAGLVGSGTSTAGAMRIQSLMNLELAQRMNLTNMLQGNILSLEAARLLRKSNY